MNFFNIIIFNILLNPILSKKISILDLSRAKIFIIIQLLHQLRQNFFKSFNELFNATRITND